MSNKLFRIETDSYSNSYYVIAKDINSAIVKVESHINKIQTNKNTNKSILDQDGSLNLNSKEEKELEIKSISILANEIIE
jgi:hypothetical protein